ncbi:BLUF domain-containing protein [Nocardioides zeicaulis]|uniref:BLUF domain-containing protein n=1 Tax=Nocardioides zeicaulis TaxID=1776857 RepID=UPI0039EF42E4
MSSATEEMSVLELDDLLRAARLTNERCDITGMLLYAGGTFIQTLEGPADAVDARFTMIDADERHHTVFVVRREEVARRQFRAWWMGYRRIPERDALRLPGLTDYLDTGRIDGEEPRRSAVETFHRAFREHLGG